MTDFILEDNPTQYFHSYTANNTFKVNIMMNPRDAMVIAEITALPQGSEKEIQQLIDDFAVFYRKEYGAKAVLTFSPQLQEQSKNLTGNDVNGALYFDKNTLEKSINNINKKSKVAEKLATNDYRLLNKTMLLPRAAELNEFKIKYSSFINAVKINSGQYTQKREEDKLKNPFVESYAIEHKGKIIASIMLFVHNQHAYISDFIVHPNYRDQGIAQTLCAKVYEDFIPRYPEVKGGWLIAGGAGTLGVGQHLYTEVFPTVNLNANLQAQQNLILMFGSQGPRFLAAANRSEKGLVLNEENEVNAALQFLQQSPETPIVAAQPVPIAAQPVQVAPQPAPVVQFNPHTAPETQRLSDDGFSKVK